MAKIGSMAIKATEIVDTLSIDVKVTGVVPLLIKVKLCAFFLRLAAFFALPAQMEVKFNVKTGNRDQNSKSQGRVPKR
jgi:hypothetical protein